MPYIWGLDFFLITFTDNEALYSLHSCCVYLRWLTWCRESVTGSSVYVIGSE